MKQKLAYVVFVVLLGAAACTPVAKTLHPGQLVLKPGESVTSADGAVTVTFIEVVQDSRCPSDVNCVWAGNVQVLIEVRQGTELQQYTLTLGQPLDGDVNNISLADYTITLTAVNPYPISSDPTNPADYQITLDVSF